MNRAVFLDRDGTINEEMGYINHPSRFVVFPFLVDALKIFQNLKFKIIVLTNQSGVARGYFPESMVRNIHSHLQVIAEEAGCRIDGIYYCPHHPQGEIEKYRKKCSCRKPEPGMLKKAISEHKIDATGSYMIGDRYKDIKFGNSMGLKTGMVLTGYGRGEYEFQRHRWELMPDLVAENLYQMAELIAAIEKVKAVSAAP